MTPTAPAKAARPMPEPEFYSEQARIILAGREEKSVSSFQELVRVGLSADACHWVALHLPVRYAVWWGLICVMETKSGPGDETLVGQVTSWVMEPSEAMQTRLLNQLWLETPQSPVEYLAKAISWTGPSMLPAHLPVSAPNPEHAGRMIAAAVDLAAAGHAILQGPEAYLRFLEFAAAVDNGTLHWGSEPATAAKPRQNTKPQGLLPGL